MKMKNYIVKSYGYKRTKKIDKKCDDIFKKYFNYLESVKDKIDSTLYNLITYYYGFHDFDIKELKFNPWKKKVSLRLDGFDEGKHIRFENFTLYFNNVTKFNLDNDLCEEYAKGIYTERDCVLVSEIGYYDGKNYLGLFTLRGTFIDLYFDSVTLAKPNRNLLK